MFSDIVEDEQTKTETRSEALVFSANNFLNKLVGNIGILGSGVMITWAGFDIAKSLAEKELAASYLGLIFILSGSISGLLAILTISRYRITRSIHQNHLEDLGYNQTDKS